MSRQLVSPSIEVVADVVCSWCFEFQWDRIETVSNPFDAHRQVNDHPGSAEVRADEQQSRRRGVSGVPTFVVNGEALLPGAQEPELLASILGPALTGVAR